MSSRIGSTIDRGTRVRDRRSGFALRACLVATSFACEVGRGDPRCTDACRDGQRRCQGDHVVACVNGDSDACLEWSEPTSCPTATPFCFLGECLGTCRDECVQGETRCDGPKVPLRCERRDEGGCLRWLAVVACEEGECCADGDCKTACADSCVAGATVCLLNGVSRCVDVDGDGYTEWGPIDPCLTDETCSGGACLPALECNEECTESFCDGTLHRRCGEWDTDACRDASVGTECASNNPCVVARCTDAGCEASPVECPQPADECVDDDAKLRRYTNAGVCIDGSCEYAEFQDFDCPNCPACDAPCPEGQHHCEGGCVSDGDAAHCGSLCTPCDAPLNGTAVCDGGSCRFVCDAGFARCGGGCIPSDEPCGLRCAPTPWTVTAIDHFAYAEYQYADGHQSIAVDGAGGIHIGYAEPFFQNDWHWALKYAHKPTGGTWTSTTIVSDYAYATGRFISVDRGGGVHIAYSDLDDGLRYAHKAAGGTWTVAAVARGGDSASIAVDGAGGVHIAHVGGIPRVDETSVRRPLYYTYKPAGGQWASEYVTDEGTGADTSIAVDGEGGVHLVYGPDEWSSWPSRYAYKPLGGDWAPELIGSETIWPRSVAVDDAGSVHVLAVNTLNPWSASPGVLEHAYMPRGGNWTTTVIGQAHGIGIDLAVDGAGGIHATYMLYRELWYVFRAPGGARWEAQTVPFGRLPRGPRLAVDAAGGVHVTSLDRGIVYHAYECSP